MMTSFQNEETAFNLDAFSGYVQLTASAAILNSGFLRKMAEFGVFANGPVSEAETTMNADQTTLQIWSDDAKGYFLNDEGDEVCSDQLLGALYDILTEGESIEIEGSYLPFNDKRIESAAKYLKREGRILEDNIRNVIDTSKGETRNIMRRFEATEAEMKTQSTTTNIINLDHFRRMNRNE